MGLERFLRTNGRRAQIVGAIVAAAPIIMAPADDTLVSRYESKGTIEGEYATALDFMRNTNGLHLHTDTAKSRLYDEATATYDRLHEHPRIIAAREEDKKGLYVSTQIFLVGIGLVGLGTVSRVSSRFVR